MIYDLGKFNVKNHLESLKIIKSMCEKYYKDCEDIRVKNMTINGLYNFARSKYLLEKQETFIRPYIFIDRGGDCDCQTIFVTSWMINKGLDKKNIVWEICGQKQITHIFPIFTIADVEFYFDMLPKRKYDERYNYQTVRRFNYTEI
jgi:hypothetical protein